MNRHFPILQGYIFIARIGDGSVTEAAAPDALVNSEPNPVWIKAGEVTDGALNADIEYKERTVIQLGKRIIKKVPVRETYTLNATVMELNKLLVDMFFNSDTGADGTFASLGAQGRKAWIRAQGYDQGDGNRILLQGLANITPNGELQVFGEEFFQAAFAMEFEGRVQGELIGAYPA